MDGFIAVKICWSWVFKNPWPSLVWIRPAGKPNSALLTGWCPAGIYQWDLWICQWENEKKTWIKSCVNPHDANSDFLRSRCSVNEAPVGFLPLPAKVGIPSWFAERLFLGFLLLDLFLGLAPARMRESTKLRPGIQLTVRKIEVKNGRNFANNTPTSLAISEAESSTHRSW